MRYFAYTLGDYTGDVKDVGECPYARDFDLERRLYDPRPFAPDEWCEDATLLIYEGAERCTDADVFTMLLYPVVSARYYQVLRSLFSPQEMEFLPVRLVGKDTGADYGQFYIPHLLQAVPDCLAFPALFEMRLVRAKVPSQLRVFIAPHSTHTKLVFREDMVRQLERAGLTEGLGFYPLLFDDEEVVQAGVPLGLLCFATVEEQRAWAQWVLQEGAIGLLWWQRWYLQQERFVTRVGWIEDGEQLEQVPLVLREEDGAATLQLSVYWMLPEWRERMGLRVVEGEFEGALMSWLDMQALDTNGTGWYGRWDVGYQVGEVLTEASWFLPLGWQYEPLEAFEELYRWWEHLGDWYDERRVADVSVRSGRRADRELDEAVWVTEGAVRWYVGGGQLCREWGKPSVWLVGRGLRRYRSVQG